MNVRLQLFDISGDMFIDPFTDEKIIQDRESEPCSMAARSTLSHISARAQKLNDKNNSKSKMTD